MDRRTFLRLAGGATLGAATAGWSCGGSGSAGPDAGATDGAGRGPRPGGGERTLRIAVWGHFVPAYDAWFDDEFCVDWGEKHDIDVVVDHIPFNEVAARAETEVALGQGHDIFGFVWASSARFEDQILDHREIIEEVAAKVGPMHPFVERSLYNPKTGKYIGFSDYWVPNTVHYRTDLWEAVASGSEPDTWEHLLSAGPGLKTRGRPLGLSLGFGDPDANTSLIALMHAYGAFLQDENAHPTIGSRATVEAVKVMTEIYRSAMSDEVLAWDGTSNNRFLANGTGSLILNPISALRAIEKQDPDLASRIALAPVPGGPGGRLAPYLIGTNVIWNFARNPEAAKQFLVDLALAAGDELTRSEYYNLPSFPGAVPRLGDIVGTGGPDPPGRYALLAGAQDWTTNMGYPGHSNAPVDEIFEHSLVVQMFASAVTGELAPEEAVQRAADQTEPIYTKWRERGKI